MKMNNQIFRMKVEKRICELELELSELEKSLLTIGSFRFISLIEMRCKKIKGLKLILRKKLDIDRKMLYVHRYSLGFES